MSNTILTQIPAPSTSEFHININSVYLNQLCPTRGLVEGFHCSKSIPYILTTCPYFDNFKFNILLQVVFSATLSHLLPLQLGFECFQYMSLS